MRYFENLEFFKPNGTIYLIIGGESEADPSLLTTGLIYELANETNGAMFMSEHRYYGKSMPLDSTVTENLKYLSSRQALADLATLLENIKSSPKFKLSKVVAIGGSYAGNLAAWVKLLYPDMINAAIASSAPVLAKKDFYEYMDKVADDYKRFGTPECLDNIIKYFHRYDRLFKTKEGIEQLIKEENICKDNDMTKPENQQLFFSIISLGFVAEAQDGVPKDLEEICKKLANISSEAVLKIGTDVVQASFWDEENQCVYYDFNNYIENMSAEDRSWTYQTCTEFGYFATTNSDEQPFTKNFPLEWYIKTCTRAFGAEFDEKRIDEGIKTTNELYGGLKPNVTNVFFYNGEMDPYSLLGILKDISDNAPARVISRESHCRDLWSTESDTKELKELRRYEKYLIKKWLGLPNNKY